MKKINNQPTLVPDLYIPMLEEHPTLCVKITMNYIMLWTNFDRSNPEQESDNNEGNPHCLTCSALQTQIHKTGAFS